MKTIVPPSSKENEMMVLGCMLTNFHAIDRATRLLKEEDFYFYEHRVLFSIISQIYLSGKNLDIHIVSEILKERGKLEVVGGISYIINLAHFVGTSAYIEEYIDLIKIDSSKRRLFLFAQKVQKSVLEDGENLHLEIENFQHELEGIKKNRSRADVLYEKHLLPESEAIVRNDFIKTNSSISVGMMLGNIDMRLQGGAITIIAGPTGHGKTLMKINLILNYLNLYPEKQVYFFSYEESRPSIISLFLNAYIGEDISCNNRTSIKSYLGDGDLQSLYKDRVGFFIKKKDCFFQDLIETGRLKVCYCDYSIEELSELVKFLKEKTSVGLIAVDYMQLLKTSKKKTSSRQEELKEVCLLLKDLAIETGLPILVGAQFNRTVVNEAAMSLVSIGESGDIERVANTILGLWNRNYEGFTEEGNKGKDGKKRLKESALYVEVLKGREIGAGHSSVFDFHGNSGRIRFTKTNPCIFG